MTKIKRPKPASKAQHPTTQGTPAGQTAVKKVGLVKTNGATASRQPGKIDKLIAMMRRVKGATIADLTKATDWQAHSVRGAISGTIKKKRGLTVVFEKSGDVRDYRIAS